MAAPTSAAVELLGLLERLSAGPAPDDEARYEYDVWQSLPGSWNASAAWLVPGPQGRWARVVFTGARSRAEAEAAVLGALRAVAGGGR